MPVPGHLPVGEKFFATIRRDGLEEVIQEKGVSLKFETIADAKRYAAAVIQKAIDAVRPPHIETQAEIDARIHMEWKIAQAEKLRLEREAFDMRTVDVLVKKKRRIAR